MGNRLAVAAACALLTLGFASGLTRADDPPAERPHGASAIGGVPEPLVAGRDAYAQVASGRQLDRVMAQCAGERVRFEVRTFASLGTFLESQEVIGATDIVLGSPGPAVVEIPITGARADRARPAVSVAMGECFAQGDFYLESHNLGYVNEGNNEISVGTIELQGEALDTELELWVGGAVRDYAGTITITANGVLCSRVELAGGKGPVNLHIGRAGEPPACREPGAHIVLFDQWERPFLTEFILEPGVTWGLVNFAVDVFAAGSLGGESADVLPVSVPSVAGEPLVPDPDVTGAPQPTAAVSPAKDGESWLRPALLALGVVMAGVILAAARKFHRR